MLDATPPFSTSAPLSRFRRDDVTVAGDAATRYRAWDGLTGQFVTLIEFHPERIVDTAIDRSFSARFARESQVLAAINHPNVNRVVAWGSESDRPFLVVAAPPGRTLAEAIRDQGAFTPTEATSIVRQILAGLGAIHEANLLHLKLTPRTIHIGDDGVIRITDVGLTATQALNAAGDATSRLDSDRYQAPEFLDGLDVSEATDIYAAGAIFYEALTGQAPFPGNNPVLVRYAKMHAAPPVPGRLITWGIPPALDVVIGHALARDVIDRYLDSRAMLDALDEVAWQFEPPVTMTAPQVTPQASHSRDDLSAHPSWAPPVRYQPPLKSIDLVRPVPMKRARKTNSGWVVPLVIAGLAIAVLGVALVHNLTSEQPKEAVAGVSVLETTAPSSSPTARIINADRDDDANAGSTKAAKPDDERTTKATKTPKPTRTPTSDSDD